MDEGRDVPMNPLDYLLILRRRIRWVLIPMAICLVLGVAITFLLPVKYRSAVTIALSSGSLSSDLARPIDREERVRAIGQQLFDPALLAKVAKQEHLTPATPTEAEIVTLRQRIQIALPEPVPGTEPGQVDVYLITYADAPADRARRVAQRLAEAFVDETSKVQQVKLEGTSEFYAAQLREAKAELDRLDTKMAAAKARNIGRLPEQTNANVAMLTAKRQQLETSDTELRNQQDRLRTVEQQISMFAQEADELPANQAPTTPQQRVIQLQRDLAAARLKYTDNYPDVQNIKEELERAKKDAAAERNLPPEDQAAALKQNPAYRALLADRDQTNQRIRDVRHTIEQINREVSWYQARIEGAPLVEQEIHGLEQDRDIVSKRVEDLSSKLQAARLQEDSNRKRGSEHFRILYPATLPDAPSEPNRLRLLLVTAGVAFFLGIGCGIGREYLDQSIRDARALQRDFDLPVLAEIPHINRAA